MTKNKIAIFTNFYYYDPTYSLIRIAESQLKQLVKNNYNVVFIATEGFKAPKDSVFEQVEIRYIPTIPLENEKVTETFESDVEKLIEPTKKALEDVKIAITHDIFYQIANLPHNEACRRVMQADPEIFWLNWIHSVPAQKGEFDKYPMDCRFKPVPNSYMVYPNDWDKLRVAKMYGIEMAEVKVVHHSIDIAEFNKFDPETAEFAEKYKLYQADVIAVYPLRMDRGKQPDKMVRIMAELKKRGLDVRCIIADFQSTGERFLEYKKEIKEIAQEMGLGDDLIFTSDWREELRLGSPYSFISDLFKLSNLFILPSNSETFSLVALESAIGKNLMVLNQDFPPMKDIYGKDPVYFGFGSNVNALTQDFGSTTTEFNQGYIENIATAIQYYLTHDKVIGSYDRCRKLYNIDYVFKTEIEPLIASVTDISILKKPPVISEFKIIPIAKKPKFSIILPTQNREKMLPIAIKSVLNQTFEDFELIIVDDGSQDETEKIVSEFKDERIKYKKLEQNVGRVIARRTGMEMARGDWIYWLDDDDEIVSRALEILNHNIGLYPDYKVFHFGQIVFSLIGTTIKTAQELSDNEKGEGMGHFDTGKVGTGGFLFKRECLGNTVLLPDAYDCNELADWFGEQVKKWWEENNLPIAELPKYNRNDRWCGNPWGDDMVQIWLLTRKYKSKKLPLNLYIAYQKGEEWKL